MWRTRWVTAGFLAAAIALVPWIAVLGTTLPASHHDRHYAIAWAGFDALMAACLAATALLARRRDPRTGLTAAATGALAVVDAWFDVLTALPGRELNEALAMAAFGELPLAALCTVVALSSCRVPPPAVPFTREGSSWRQSSPSSPAAPPASPSSQRAWEPVTTAPRRNWPAA